MNSGRDLDMLIAEKVMGWTKKKVTYDTGTNWMWLDKHGHIVNALDVQDCPSYSTDIASAWKIVEEVYAWEIDVKISNIPEQVGFSGYSCRILTPIGEYFSISKESAAHAICLAALKTTVKSLND